MRLSNLPKKILFLDIETEASADLNAVGTGAYFSCPFTRITAAAYAKGREGEVKAIDWNTQKDELLEAIKEANMLVAHNATFDFMGLGIDPDTADQMLGCTRAMCALANMPQGLKDAAKAFNVVHQKLSKPELLNIGGQSGLFDYGNATDEQKAEFFAYNKKDVEAMRELFYNIVELMPAIELKGIDAHLRVNLRGIPFDSERLKEEMDKALAEQKELGDAFQKKAGFGPGELSKLKDYLAAKYDFFWQEVEGGEGENLLGKEKKRVLDPEWKSMNSLTLGKLKSKVNKKDQELLALRDQFGKNDAVKLERISNMMSKECRYGHCAYLRDVFVYAQAVTGRWSSKGAQMHNNKRGGVVKQLVVPPRGWKMYVADYSQIEMRLAIWLSGGVEELQIIHKGKFYEEVAARVYGKTIEEVSPQERFMGKQLALGCNYGMGAERFVWTCAQYGEVVKPEEAENLVGLYRTEVMPLIPKAWASLHQAAIQAVENPKAVIQPKGVKGVQFEFVGGAYNLLYVHLPTKRRLHYWQAKIIEDERGRKAIEYYDPTKKNVMLSIDTGAHWLENLSQAVSRDLLLRSMIRFNEARHLKVLPFLHIHDELVVLFKGDATEKQRKVLDSLMLDNKFAEGDGSKYPLLAVESHIVKSWGEAK